ncbi:calcium/sodium antiporter [Sphaerochaeta globosa]|uniref:Na+/Ca+ antiporter, CaCA family n=1 Tax=Sphaerochaeta globosa (strain ATCC BAA-1886 / DSM 22777 / Buddy) TaxID=158189 RepID=F0RZ33_SPHGB|nr:calcium/sodium antiporter [Sphaerochaeta globosa]ADY13240.1 Na+/Ca+ antiporter, CaCA family [Sphaerochaeta globosa str. Buddy]
MILPILAVVLGLVVLVISSDRFVDGAAATARHFGMPSLLIGMVIVGFGTSAPELVVSVLSAIRGNAGIAIGNAYGSNIANIALILGLTALLSPVQVSSKILKKELPILTLVTLLSFFLLYDLNISLFDAGILLLCIALLMVWSIFNGLKNEPDTLADTIDEAVPEPISMRRAVLYLIFGLLFLILSSRLLVWGAIEIAQFFGVSDLVIGLTIVAVGTSLPELASSIIAAKKGEHDIAMGNVIGSNLFNSTAVVGVAGAIYPFEIESLVLRRDMSTMLILTVSLFIIGYGFRKNRQGRVNRFEGAVLLSMYIGYTILLMRTAV